MPDVGVPDAATADGAPGIDAGPDAPAAAPCVWVDDGVGPAGATKLSVDVVASGLAVPWGLAFPAKNEILVTEMGGTLRLIKDGKLEPKPLLTLPTPTPPGKHGKGLHGIALHPQFASNRLFYLHHVHPGPSPDEWIVRVTRFKLAADSKSATKDKVILDNLPAGFFHNGGRMRFGADGMLYVSTGDVNQPDNSKDLKSPAGKLLRVTAEGAIPADNPWAGNPAVLSGIRNSQGFDFLDSKRLVIADHGPSGEVEQRTGQDEVTIAAPGDNLGWPTVSGCTTAAGTVPPALSWKSAVPPGAIIVYRGDAIPGWKGSLLMTSLGQKALLRITLDPKDPRRVTGREVYLQGDTTTAHGRMRAIELGADGQLYVTTSNCDDHGSCDSPGDQVLRITAGS